MAWAANCQWGRPSSSYEKSKWRERELQVHHWRCANATGYVQKHWAHNSHRAALDKFTEHANSRRGVVLELREKKIERENKLLLKRITKTLTKKAPKFVALERGNAFKISNGEVLQMGPKSITMDSRVHEAKRINLENRFILKRLQTTRPHLDRRKWEKDYERHVKHKRVMSRSAKVKKLKTLQGKNLLPAHFRNRGKQPKIGRSGRRRKQGGGRSGRGGGGSSSVKLPHFAGRTDLDLPANFEESGAYEIEGAPNASSSMRGEDSRARSRRKRKGAAPVAMAGDVVRKAVLISGVPTLCTVRLTRRQEDGGLFMTVRAHNVASNTDYVIDIVTGRRASQEGSVKLKRIDTVLKRLVLLADPSVPGTLKLAYVSSKAAQK